MTMHLMNVRVTERSPKKKKHSSSKAAAKARENSDSWKKLLSKWDVKPVGKKSKKSGKLSGYSLEVPPERSTRHIESLDSRNGVAPLREVNHYSGNDMTGIAVLHKSISVPIFNKQSAEDASKMRR